MSAEKQSSDIKENKHLQEVPKWPDFQIFIDSESGRIPVTKVNGWRHFSEILEDDFFNT